MDDATLIERRRTSQMAFYRALGSAAPGSHGVRCARGCRRRSCPSMPGALAAQRGHSTPTRRRCSTRTTRSPSCTRPRASAPGPSGSSPVTRSSSPGSRPAATRSTAARRSWPRAMERARPRAGRRARSTSIRRRTGRVLGELNDRAYGLPDATFAPTLSRHARSRDARVHRAAGRRPGGRAWRRVDGPDGDCALELVATLPEAQGRGLASGLDRATRCARARDVAATR